jgi:hypothetical protein
MAETLKKAATAAKDAGDKLSKAVAGARTRSGEPKVTKPPPKPKTEEPKPVPAKTKTAYIDGFIAEETAHMDRVDIPDDTGDMMYTAIKAILYHKQRIAEAELAKKHLEDA